MSAHRSPITGMECKREELTGEPCDGIGHISVASDYSPSGMEETQQ